MKDDNDSQNQYQDDDNIESNNKLNNLQQPRYHKTRSINYDSGEGCNDAMD